MASGRDVLPASVRPTHYALALAPDPAAAVFSGDVAVELDVVESTSLLVANASELTILEASVVVVSPAAARSTQVAKSISIDQVAETVTFEFESPLPAGAKATLHVKFTGIHNDKMAGFYRSAYSDKVSGAKSYLAVTQFEATDARRALPCWDEPNIKATFDSTLIVAPHLTALSNTNAIEESHFVRDGKPLKSVKFARTPIMSTYLLAFAVGEFDFVGTQARPTAPASACPIDVRVYTLRGESEHGRFALNVAARTLEYFSQYFDVAYPLPKMDMIAIPDFAAGAMENWGLVTYRQAALLVSENTSARSKQGVAYVVGHELAHQWFGNLVTMDWWSELWLNEGFATFVGWLATDHLYPDWQIWRNFVTEEFSSGLRLDALRSSHPIEVDVKSPAEINQIFDAISYSKGASVIRMLSNFLANDVFANGVRAYLKKFAFSNAKTVDLWTSLSQASGIDVAALMYPWTREMGYPLITVTDEAFDATRQEITLTIRQTRFLSSGSLTAEEEAAAPIWIVPITVATHINPHSPTRHLVKEKEAKITFPYSKTTGHFWKFNYKCTGFYRVGLTTEQQSALGAALSGDLNRVTVEDRMELVSTAFAAAKAGVGSTLGALEIVKSFAAEEDYYVLEAICIELHELKEISYARPEIVAGIDALERYIFSAKAARLGFDHAESDDHLLRLKRRLVVSAAASSKDTAVVDELKRRFWKYVNGDKSAFPADLRATAFSIANKNTDDTSVFDALLNIYKNETEVDTRNDVLRTLGTSPNIDIVKRCLGLALDAELIRTQDLMYVIRSMSGSPKTVEVNALMWAWVLEHWESLCERLSSSLSLLGHCVGGCVRNNIDLDFADTVEAWSRGEDAPDEQAKKKRLDQLKSVRRTLDQTLERLRASAHWLLRDGDVIAEWASSQKY